MSEENIFESTAAPDAGKTSGFSVSVEDGKSEDTAANGSGESNAKPKEGHAGSDPEYTKNFKDRVDRVRRNERARFEKELKSREEAWEKRFKELEARVGGAQPKTLKREDFKSDEEFAAAKREAAIDEIMKRIDERSGAKAKEDEEAKAKQAEAEEVQRKFAAKFQESMQRSLSQEQQQAVMVAVNDENSAINTFLTSPAGTTLQNWLFDDCTIPADVILYLEQNADKMERLATLSPRRQVEQLDILERYLAKAAGAKKGQAGNQGTEGEPEDEGGRKPPVIGKFGGSSRAIPEFSKLSDRERVSRLIKAMRSR